MKRPFSGILKEIVITKGWGFKNTLSFDDEGGIKSVFIAFKQRPENEESRSRKNKIRSNLMF